MIENRVAIVTWASRGIGNAIAANLAAIRQPGNPVVYVQADVSSAAGRQRIVDAALSNFGCIDILFNNAGVALKVRMDILETTEESMDHVLGINLKSTFFLAQAVAKVMCKEVGEIPGIAPKIVNISSISAYTSSTMRAEYCISKAVISMVTLLFADRLANEGINVYEVRPGVINTVSPSVVKGKYDALIADGLTPIKRWGQPADVANAVSVLCSGLLDFSTGEVINVDGGFHIRRL